MSDRRAWVRIDADEAHAPYLAIARPGEPVERIDLSVHTAARLGMEAIQAVQVALSRRPDLARQEPGSEPGPEPFIGQLGE